MNKLQVYIFILNYNVVLDEPMKEAVEIRIPAECEADACVMLGELLGAPIMSKCGLVGTDDY